MEYNVRQQLTRITQSGKVVDGSSGTTQFAYDSANKRIWKKNGSAEEFYFYGAQGEVLGAYKLVPDNQLPSTLRFQRLWTNEYFAGRMIKSQDKWVLTDRLGSVRYSHILYVGEDRGRITYYPYGEIRSEQYPNPSPPAMYARPLYGTYTRDHDTNLDYADQRYYASTYARFLTPDPYQASAGPSELGSWNRYAYVEGDPVNFGDPSGLFSISREAHDLLSHADSGWGGFGGCTYNPVAGPFLPQGPVCLSPIPLLFAFPAADDEKKGSSGFVVALVLIDLPPPSGAGRPESS
jgi:RHS repeat-associated protein